MIASRPKLHVNICITNTLQLQALKNEISMSKGGRKEREKERKKERERRIMRADKSSSAV